MIPLGLILTSADSLDQVQTALRTARLDRLKVVTAWGLSWTPAIIAEIVRSVPHLVVRTSWGDPSYDRGARASFDIIQCLEELRLWVAAKPTIEIELGNEPLIRDLDSDTFIWHYLYTLNQMIVACRKEFPRARLIAPAHMVDHRIRVGSELDGVRKFLRAGANTLVRCDALGIHAYSQEQALHAIAMTQELVSSGHPLVLTEFGLNVHEDPITKMGMYRQVIDGLPIESAYLFHLDILGAPAMPDYHLTPDHLEALGGASEDPDATVYPTARIDNFIMDVRRWGTVAAFERHLARYRYAEVAPWAKGVVIHHTYRPLVKDWRGVPSMLAMAKFYRDTVDNGAGNPKGGWPSGPHLYIVSGAPNPDHDGIWQFCPLNSKEAVHARAANGKTWGIEVVGDYDKTSWPPDVSHLVVGASAALLRWANLAVNATTLTPHHQWASDKTCPGKAIDMEAVRRAVSLAK